MYVHKPLGDYGRTPEKALDGISAEVDRIIAGFSLGADGCVAGVPQPPPLSSNGGGYNRDVDREEEEEEEEEDDGGGGGGVWRASSAEAPADLQCIMGAAHEHLDLFEYSCRSRDGGVSHGPLSEHTGLAATPCFEGSLLLVQIVAANFRRICNPSAKITALLLLVRLGYHSSNSDILRRILPVVVLAFHDDLPTIRVMGIRAARSLTSCITSYTSFESNIYSSYLFQELTPLSKDGEITVRVAFAQSICHFAVAAKHCLELGHLRKQTLSHVAFEQTRSRANSSSSSNGLPTAPNTPPRGSVASAASSTTTDRMSARGVRTIRGTPLKSGSELDSTRTSVMLDDGLVDESGLPETLVPSAYDRRLRELRNTVSNWIRNCVLDPVYQEERSPEILASHGSTVKRALLHELESLCHFFGTERTVQELLSQLITFLNDSDWELRLAFCSSIPRMCRFVGPDLTCDFIIPCLETALYDVEDTVVVATLYAINDLNRTSLLSQETLLAIAHKAAPLLVHPTSTVRHAAIVFVAAICSYIEAADTTSLMLPLLLPVLKYDISGHRHVTEAVLEAALVPPVKEDLFREIINKKLVGLDPQNGRRISVHATDRTAAYTTSNSSIGEVSANLTTKGGGNVVGNKGSQGNQVDLAMTCPELAPVLVFLDNYTTLLAQELSKRTLRWHNEELQRSNKRASNKKYTNRCALIATLL
jgi:hypothetical protein